MFFKQSQEKNKILGIRLDEASLKEFERFCEARNVSKSEIARKAITKYIILNYNEDTNPKLIFSKSQFRNILDNLTESQIDSLVDVSINNGTQDMQSLENIVNKPSLATLAQTEIDFQLKTLLKFVFSKMGENWFNQIDYHWENATVTVTGTHSLGFNFSQYISKLLQRYVGLHGYILTEEQWQYQNRDAQTLFHIDLTFSPRGD